MNPLILDGEPEAAKNGRGLLAHREVSSTDEWFTPRSILEALGEFDLDPAAPIPSRRPWSTATLHYSTDDNGLVKPWDGRVWLNPPYDRYQIGKWLGRMAAHGNGIALVFARTDTAWFHDFIFPHASAILFLAGRVIFRDVRGKPSKWNPAAPSCLVAYSRSNADCLRKCGLKGKFVSLQ